MKLQLARTIYLSIPLLAVFMLSQLASAQCDQDITIYGSELYASGSVSFGSEIYQAGDVNNDGYPDILVVGDGSNYSSSLEATVFSGLNGELIRSFYNNPTRISGAGGFGHYDDDDYADIMVNGVVYSGLTGDTLANYFDVAQNAISAGDLNGDGKHDFLVTDINWSTTDGRVDVLSGANGDTLRSWIGRAGNKGTFGWSVAVAGDCDGDGVNDIIIGEPRYDNGISNRDAGKIYVYSGRTGSTLYSRVGPSGFIQFGYNVGGAGDVDNDGFDDILVSGHNESSSSPLSVWVWSVEERSVLHIVKGDDYKDEFGTAMDGIGDINNDGYDDFVVTAFRYDFSNTNYRNAGNVYIYSGIDGSIIQETYELNASPRQLLGKAVRGLGDVDGDGSPDFAVGAIWAKKAGDPSNDFRGAVYIYKCPIPTDVNELVEGVLPTGFGLTQNYPNPFNPETTFGFSIPVRANVLVEIFNIAGQKVRTLLDKTVSAGQHQISWNGENSSGKKVTSGVYLYRLSSGELTDSRKMILIK